MRNLHPKIRKCPECGKGDVTIRLLVRTHKAQEWLFECVLCQFVATLVGLKQEVCDRFNSKEYRKGLPK